MKIRRQFFRLIFLALFFLLNFSFVPAQQGSGSGIGTSGVMSPPYEKEDDTTGSVVRGRVFYQDTSRPVRRGWIGFQKIRELIEPKNDSSEGKITVVSRSYGNEKYVLTNDEGEFVMKGVKAGVYQPIVKVQGVLNPGYNDADNPNFQQITIDGVSEIQTNIGVQRGGAISGRVLYADGEPVIGARIQILTKKDERFTYFSGDQSGNNSFVTDDRGFYRFTALPANEYIVFVAELSSQNGSGNSTNGYISNSNDSILKTFYPNAAEVKNAKPLNVFLGQELSDINLTVNDRRLFKISGSAVAKGNNLPLKDMQISFQKIGEDISNNYSSNSSKQTETDARGNWILVDLPAGKYRLTAAAKNSSDYDGNQPEPIANQPKYAPVSKEIEIGNENLTDVLFEIPKQATISGTVTVEDGKPLPDYVTFGAFDEEKETNSSAYLRNQIDKNNQAQKPNNEFHIEGLSAGKYFLTASTGGKYFAKSITLKNSDAKNTPIEIKDGENIEGVQIVLSADSGIVKGRINNYKNEGRTFIALIPNVKSRMRAERLIGGGGIPKANGDFEFDAAPGEYLAIIGTDASRPKSEADFDEWFKKVVKDAPKVTIKKGETTNIDLDYPK